MADQRFSPLLAALVVAGTSTLRFDHSRQTPDPSEPGRPTAHYCAVKDMGTPSAPNPRITEEPIWFREPGAIAEGDDGGMWSTSPSGGKFGKGAAFKIMPDGRIAWIHPFDGGLLGGAPQGGMTNGHDGYFYGTASGGGTLGTGTLFRVPATGGTPRILYNFRNGSTAGLVPPCPKTQRCPWSPKQLADAAGSYPLTPPVMGPAGTLYGVTWYSRNQQFGTLYAISPPYDSTTFRTLCIFDPRMAADTTMARYVCHPELTTPNSLILDRNGSTLYGTTAGGNGAVFSATTGGKVAMLHQFDLTQGAKPTNVMQASDGVLYGTTINGGDLGGGVVWRMDPSGAGFRVMTSFRIGKFIAGITPLGALVEGKDERGRPDGYLYGTTKFGGAEGRGTIYKIRRDGDSLDLHVLHDFSLYATGRSAVTPAFLHSDGSLYGFTYQGGLRDAGVFYRLSGQDLDPLRTRPMTVGPANPAHPDNLAVPKDNLVTVGTHVQAFQPPNRPLPGITDDGIAIKVACRNPHFVQFIYRENIAPDGSHVAGVYAPSSGEYQLTTDPRNPVWHSDAAGKPDAFYDHGRGAGWYRYTSGANTALIIFDQPNFAGSYFPATEQTKDATSHTWKATFRTFAICNCQVVREIWWTVQMYRGAKSYKDVRIWAADDKALSWINPQLVSDGFRPIP